MHSPLKNSKIPFTFYLFIGLAITFVLIVIGIYMFYFGRNGVSRNPSDWGPFGDYFGGVLNPIFGFLSLIALLITIHLQLHSIKVSEEAHSKQNEYLERKEKKEEWQAIICHIEKLIQKQAETKIIKNGVVVGNIGSAISRVGELMSKKGIHGDTNFANEQLKSICDGITIEKLYCLRSALTSLLEYLVKYQKYIVENDTAIISHYVSSYIGLIGNLGQMGLIDKRGMNLLDKIGRK